MTYNERNAHPRDSRLSFDAEQHVYTVADCVFDSVTTLVEQCFEQFDADYWAERKATPDRPAEVIKAEWEERGRIARDLGTAMHQHIEEHYLGCDTSEAERTDPSFAIFKLFAAHTRLTPYRTEWPIYLEECRLAGTLDFLERTDDGVYNIYDWKRSTKLINAVGQPIVENPMGKCALPPLTNLPDTTYYHYALQLSIYRFILKAKYDIEVAKSYLGVFHPDLQMPYVLDVPYLEGEVRLVLSKRMKG